MHSTRGSSPARRRCARGYRAPAATGTGCGKNGSAENRVHDLDRRLNRAHRFCRLHDLRIGPVAAGCFGFGTWSNDSNYEATIWDFTDRAEVGRVNTSATGQSYMPAVVIPIPIIAPVQGTACDGIGEQLLEFLSSEY